MNDQDERHELLGRLETPPEFKDWASNTLPTPGISNGHQTMAEGRGTSEHETSHSNLSSPRASGHRSSFRGAKSEARAPLSSLFHVFFGKFPPLRGLFTNSISLLFSFATVARVCEFRDVRSYQ